MTQKEERRLASQRITIAKVGVMAAEVLKQGLRQ